MSQNTRFPETVVVRLPEGSRKRLNALPPAIGLSPSAVLRLAILDRLDQLERRNQATPTEDPRERA